MSAEKFQINNLTKGNLPRLPFSRAKKTILGKKYDLSLVFTGNGLAKKLNKIYRGKDKPANVLSFALDKQVGEIFINLTKVKTDAELALLFIHALLHLKGRRHSSKMESEEKKFLSLIFHYDSPNSQRHRYRQPADKNHGHRNDKRFFVATHHRRRSG